MDSLTLYRTILALVLSSHVRFHDLRCLMTFVWAIVGLICEKTVHLSKWSNYRPGASLAASKQRQFVRWLRNPKIQVAPIYQKLAQQALVGWAGETVYLALDSTSLWDRFVIVRVALIYRGRAVPLSWLVVEQASTSVAFEIYKPILKDAARCLPTGCRVILSADRGFDDIDLMRLARDLGWSFRIRLKGSLWVYRANKPALKVSRLIPAKGEALFAQKVWLTGRFFGPVHLALAQVYAANGVETWAVVSDEPTNLHTFDEDGLRFDLEEDFLDDKSAGFQIEASEIRDTGMLSRLGLVLATTTLYLVSTGTQVVAQGWRAWVDPHWQRGLSYPQIGWRWVEHALVNAKPLLASLRLPPGPDPEPVYASKAQAATPVAILDYIHEEIT